MIESHKRTITKSVTYRISAWSITVPVTLAMTGSWAMALGGSTLLHALLTVAYYIHERAWLKVKWGMNQPLHTKT